MIISRLGPIEAKLRLHKVSMFRNLLDHVPRPANAALMPTLGFLAVYVLVHETGFTISGRDIHPLPLGALAFGLLLGLDTTTRAQARTFFIRLGLCCVTLGSVFVILSIMPVEPVLVQKAWVSIASLFAVVFAGFTFFGSDADLQAMSCRWSPKETPDKRGIMAIASLRLAWDAFAAALAFRYLSVELWVLTVTFGRVVSFFLFELAVVALLYRPSRP